MSLDSKITNMKFEIDNWINVKKKGDIIVEHIGEFTTELIDSILPNMEKELNEKIELDSVRKKVFHIFIECIQNLHHHIEPINKIGDIYGTTRLGAIFLVIDGSFCRITTGNFIKKDIISNLKSRIDTLNSMTDNEIKMLYRDTINNKTFSEKGGAGIGMIDMARKTGNKLNYEFFDVEDAPDLAFFSFDVCIS